MYKVKFCNQTLALKVVICKSEVEYESAVSEIHFLKKFVTAESDPNSNATAEGCPVRLTIQVVVWHRRNRQVLVLMDLEKIKVVLLRILRLVLKAVLKPTSPKSQTL